MHRPLFALLLSYAVGTLAAIVPASAQSGPPSAQPSIQATASVAQRDSAGRRQYTLRSQRFLITRWMERGDPMTAMRNE